MNPYKKNLFHIENFIDCIKNQKKYSSHTIRAYTGDLKNLIEYLGEEKLIIDLNKYDLHEYVIIISKRISGKTLSRKIATIKSFYKFLLDEKIVPINISKSIRIPKTEKKLPNYLTKEEMRIFFEETIANIKISSRDLLIIDILYSTGIRTSECISILHENINLTKKTIKVFGKGSKSRLVVFGEKTKLNILNYLNENNNKINSEFLFPSPQRKTSKSKNHCITTRTIYNIVKKYIKLVSSNEKLGPHSLRHSFATHLLQSGSDLMAIKELLGHESLGSTQIYTHLDTERMKKIYKQSHPHAK